MSLFYFFILVHFVVAVFLSNVMYKRIRRFFPNETKCISQIGDKENQEGLLQDSTSDENNQEFMRRDLNSLTFSRILFGTVTGLVYIRFILFFVLLIFNSILFTIMHLFTLCFRKPATPPRTSIWKRFIVKLIIYISIFPIQIMMLFITSYSKYQSKKVTEVYKKYLGPDYNILEDKKFSIYISNHQGWMEALHWVIHITPGFIAKDELGKIPLVGLLLEKIDCLLVNRKDKDNRHWIAEQMKLRQELYLNEETHTPLLIYPEGTVTVGTHLLEFKKGAFMQLLPIKPIVSVINDEGPGSYQSPMIIFEHMYYIYCFVWHYSKFYELPIIEYNEFMKSNFKREGENDDDTYARVANEMYREIFDLKFSSKTFRELDDYELYKKKSYN